MTKSKELKELASSLNKEGTIPGPSKSESSTGIMDVYQNIGYVQKTGKMSFGKTNYKYAGESDLIAAIRPEMVKANVSVKCVNIETIICEWQGNIFKYVGAYTYRFTNERTGVYSDVEAIGSGFDTGDKAPYKAATGALKYALRQTFLIETGDDPDQTSSEEQHEKIVPTDGVKQFETPKLFREAFADLKTQIEEHDKYAIKDWEKGHREELKKIWLHDSQYGQELRDMIDAKYDPKD